MKLQKLIIRAFAATNGEDAEWPIRYANSLLDNENNFAIIGHFTLDE
jgi:hypothetical protein